MSKTLDRLRVDHRRLRNVLSALATKGEELRAHPGAQNTDHLYCLIDYVVAYPDKVHHPLEDQVFDALLQAELQPEQVQQVELNRAQHQELLAATTDLMDQVDTPTGEVDVEQLSAQLAQYIERQLMHIKFEEQRILPMAQEHIPAAVWAQLDEQFGETADPLFDQADRSYAAIYPYLVVDPEEAEARNRTEPLLRYLSATGLPWDAPAEASEGGGKH